MAEIQNPQQNFEIIFQYFTDNGSQVDKYGIKYLTPTLQYQTSIEFYETLAEIMSGSNF